MLFLQLCCVGVASPNTAALSIAPFARNAGTASALLGFMQLGIGALASIAVGSFNAQNITPLAGIMCASAILACIVFFVGRTKIVATVETAGDAVVVH
jgi:DHA1 family bicyclomycin/chloramphenicol resistance-like MFS transporter